MNAPVSPDVLDRAIGIVAPIAPHYAELLRWVRSGAMALIEVPRDAIWPKRQLKAVQKPLLVLLGDDDEMATGPAGWRCLNAGCRWPRAAVVHAAGAESGQYEAFGALAVMNRRLLLVETTSAHAAAWIAALRLHRVPVTAILPRGGVHPLPVQPEQVQ